MRSGKTRLSDPSNETILSINFVLGEGNSSSALLFFTGHRNVDLEPVTSCKSGRKHSYAEATKEPTKGLSLRCFKPHFLCLWILTLRILWHMQTGP